MNVSAVRKMTKAPRKDHLLNLPPQRVTVRCALCNWKRVNVLAAESSAFYRAHRDHRHA